MASFGATREDLLRYKTLILSGIMSDPPTTDYFVVDGDLYYWSVGNWVQMTDVNNEVGGKVPMLVTPVQATAFQSLVSEYGTLADLLAVASPGAGQRARVAGAVIPGGTPYTAWIYDGALWRLDTQQSLLDDVATVTGVTGTTEQVLRPMLLPAGLLPLLRRIEVAWTMTRSGTTDALTTRVRLGSAGTAVDTQLAQDANLNGSRSRGYQHIGSALNATTWRQVHNGVNGWGLATNTTTAAPLDTTVSNMAGALYLSLTAQMGGSTDTPTLSALAIRAV